MPRRRDRGARGREDIHFQRPDLTPDRSPRDSTRSKEPTHPLFYHASPGFQVRRARSIPHGDAKTQNHRERKQSRGGRGAAKGEKRKEGWATGDYREGGAPPATTAKNEIGFCFLRGFRERGELESLSWMFFLHIENYCFSCIHKLHDEEVKNIYNFLSYLQKIIQKKIKQTIYQDLVIYK